MTKRYRESVDVQTVPQAVGPSPPATFTWRGGTYQVLSILGHWREDATWWAGGGVEVPQRDLWRVEAQNGSPGRGVYELVAEGEVWRLDRVWD